MLSWFSRRSVLHEIFLNQRSIGTQYFFLRSDTLKMINTENFLQILVTRNLYTLHLLFKISCIAMAIMINKSCHAMNLCRRFICRSCLQEFVVKIHILPHYATLMRYMILQILLIARNTRNSFRHTFEISPFCHVEIRCLGDVFRNINNIFDCLTQKMFDEQCFMM